MAKKPIVEKIIINMGDIEACMMLDEARELQRVLNDLFGNAVRVVNEHHHHNHNHYDWYHPQPFYTLGNSTLKYDSNTVFCSIGSTGGDKFATKI